MLSLLVSLSARLIVEMTFIVHMLPRRFLKEVPLASSKCYSNTLPDLHSPIEAGTRNISAIIEEAAIPLIEERLLLVLITKVDKCYRQRQVSGRRSAGGIVRPSD